jgi:hypothetical protein
MRLSLAPLLDDFTIHHSPNLTSTLLHFTTTPQQHTIGPSLTHFLLMNANGDLFQINEKFMNVSGSDTFLTRDDIDEHHYENSSESASGVRDSFAPELETSSLRKSSADFRNSGNVYVVEKRKRHDHCSSIVKLLSDGSDVVFGHNTWDDFQVNYYFYP